VELQAGYRSDVLVKASDKPGTYILASLPDPTKRKLPNPNATAAQTENPHVLAAVVVKDEKPAQDTALPTPDEMKTIAYNWQTDLKKEWNDNPKKPPVQKVNFDVTEDEKNFSIDGKAYNHNDKPRSLILGQIDRWEIITATVGTHIFHIHTNPFQVDRTGPDGKPETVWRDSIVVPRNDGKEGTKLDPVIIYTQYKEFTGRLVMHCHLLDHEDNGMMQEVEIVEPTR
jgi:FtsP/CotA-like multicopper oxidase with cupredoxin domain